MSALPPGQPAVLVSLLLDSAAEFGDRLDAAMDLSAFSTPEIIAALVSVAARSSEIPDIRQSCAESLAELWLQAGTYSPEDFTRLMPDAQSIVLRYLENPQPLWHAALSRLIPNGAA